VALPASYPFIEDFESGTLAGCWVVNATGAGRTVVATTNSPHGGTYHLLMDSSTTGTYSLNELVLTIDLAGQSGVVLSFYCKDFGDEPQVMPVSFTGPSYTDGVAVSADGVNWYRAVDLASAVSGVYQLFDVDLDALCAASGISYNGAFKIKFQQYDNYPVTSDGFAFDDIVVDLTPPPTITTQPTDQTAYENEAATFSVVASGSAPLTYQWRRDGVDIPSATGSSYTTSPVAPADNGALFTSVTSDPATLSVALPASYPFVEDFESGTLAGCWVVNATGAGQTVVATTNSPNGGAYHLLMDSASGYALNELVLTIDLAGQSGVVLSFYCKDFGDEPQVMPVSFTGSSDSDGVAVSADGVNWYRAVDLASAVSGVYQLFDVDLDVLCAASGISYNGAFKIKFQQYDDYPVTTDGFAFDDIVVDLPPPPTITTHPSDVTIPENETTTFTVVASGLAQLTYQWQRDGFDIPSATSSSYTILPATAADDGAVFTCVVTNAGGSVTSNPAALTVIPPYITVAVPNGGETWYHDGPDQTIDWSSGGVTGNVDIHYSTNGGGAWSVVAVDVPDTGFYTWTIPGEDSASCLVRVLETGGAGASDVSDAPFTIAPATMSVIAPNGAESWNTGSSHLISWTSTGVTDVAIEVSRDGTSWETVAAAVPAAAGSYSWTVTGPDSTICLVRVSDAADGSPTDESDATFSIVLAVDHFDFDPVASPQDANVAFPVTISAKSLIGLPVTAFTGTVDLSATNQVGGQIDIGSGASSWDYPLHTYYHDARTQVIYLSSEIGGPMPLDALALDVASLPGQTMANWTIRMKHTVLSDYSGGAQWEGTGWTTVYQNSETVSATGWVTFNFATPFIYNGVDNLMVDFSFNNSSWTSSGTCRCTASAQPRAVYYYTDSGYGDPLAWSGTSSPSPLASTYVPDVRLTGTVGGPLGAAPTVTGAFVAGEWTGNVTVLGAGAGCRLLVDDGAGHAGQSNAFDVEGLGVTSPNGGEIWGQGASETITWDSNGVSGNVDILYSIDDGAGWLPVATDIANTGSFPWSVPADDSDVCLVRVQETGGGGATDDSDAVFTITPPMIAVTAPNGGETLYQATGEIITWLGVDVSGNVDILYSTDDGTGWTPVATDVANTGSFLWPVPIEDSGLCLVRVQETGGTGLTDDSDAVFTIAVPPRASYPFVEDFESGALASCWSVNATGAGRTVVATTDSPNGGAYHLLMDSSTSGTYSLNELVLTIDLAGQSGVVLSFYCKDFGDEPQVMPVSFAGSSDSDGVAVSADGVNWYRAVDLASAVTGVYQLFDVDLDALCAASGISYNGAFKIRFQQYDDNSIATDGFAFDDIVVDLPPPPTITTHPSDAVATEPETASFFVVATSPVSLTYQWRKDGADIAGATAPGYTTPPTVLADDGAIFTCVVANAGGNVTSNPAVLWVNMAPPAIQTHPADQTAYENETATFAVVATGSAPLAYQWKLGGADIAGATAASYVTPVADPADDGNVFTCVVTNARGSVTSLPATLTVLPAFISVVAPNGGEVWYHGGMDQAVVWTSGGVTGDIDIHYSVSGGPPWISVASGVADTGSYTWTIPDEDSASCFVRLRETGGTGVDDTSDAPFAISPPVITVTAPDGGEMWYGGDIRAITWTTMGVVSNVDIQYSVDGGGGWTDEAIDVPDTGSYAWTIPDEDSPNCLVRVRETGGAGVEDTSDAPFAISPPVITVTAPDGGETWYGGDIRAITWTTLGVVSNVDIQYSVDGGGGWADEAIDVPNTGSYAWTIPDEDSANCLVRVREAGGTGVDDTSDAPFAISPPVITVTAPDGGETWYGGDIRAITWTTLGAVGNVDIQYSLDGGGGWIDEAIDVPDTGSYAWTVPDEDSANCLVRVRETGGGGSADESDGVFTITISPLLFWDDFEDGDYIGWTDGTGAYTREVTNAAAAASTTWSFTQTGGFAVHGDGVSYALPDLTPSQINFYVRSSNASNHDGFFVVGTGIATTQRAVYFRMDAGGTMMVYENGTYHSTPFAYVADQWYLITFDFNWVARTIDFYVDGGLIEADIPFYGAAVDRLSMIYLYNWTAGSQAWWDEIEFLP